MSGTKDRIRGNWNVLRGKLKQTYGELTDDDLTYTEGKEEELIGRLQRKLGKSKAEVESIVDDLAPNQGEQRERRRNT